MQLTACVRLFVPSETEVTAVVLAPFVTFPICATSRSPALVTVPVQVTLITQLL